MTDAPYFLSPEEGPIFPDEGPRLAEEADTFLRASDRDVRAEVAQQNLNDSSESSLKSFASEALKDLGITPPKSE